MRIKTRFALLTLTSTVFLSACSAEIISTLNSVIKDGISSSESSESSESSTEEVESEVSESGGNGQIGFDFGDGKGGIKASGKDTFNQFIPKDKRAVIGTIPVGVKNLSVKLKAEKDLDVELWRGSTFVVGWVKDGTGDAEISSSGKITKTFQGDVITWSGWDGDGTGAGNEYITISGTTQNSYEMRAFGYEAGNAKVDYDWGGKDD